MVPQPLFDEHHALAEAATHRPTSRWGMVIVLLLWALIAWVAWSAVAIFFD
jgi:hypothetical protein